MCIVCMRVHVCICVYVYVFMCVYVEGWRDTSFVILWNWDKTRTSLSWMFRIGINTSLIELGSFLYYVMLWEILHKIEIICVF
jgi:hypothetical protein